MHVDLDVRDIEVLITSLEYSLLQVKAQPETPPEVRKMQIADLETAKQKFQYAKR